MKAGCRFLVMETTNFYVGAKVWGESGINKTLRSQDLLELNEDLTKYCPFRPTSTDDFRKKKYYYGVVKGTLVHRAAILGMAGKFWFRGD